ncbi:methionyl-tRNA formyltransferase, mitochondrial [Scleropages formosus]|uniref:Methionyl-tRNA formyltransferase, mitochondrial n=1 Tax=Scleropages formosus TaxID=113540 RepID=A0A8C9V6M9_SCLFO|nr:methionyl-tRNA formyltransferase, mitochondrial [Scleropages formosus]
MWNMVRCARAKGFMSRARRFTGGDCALSRGSLLPLWVRRRVFSVHREHSSACVSQSHTHVRTRPPWRILFFGTDHFAEESLKCLYSSRQESGEKVVDLLEVVTLPKDLPVRRFALQNSLYVHDWPNVNAHNRFDVGVVVSFGCLLKEDLIRHFPYGILNVHPSLLPRWRGPAPIFHTVLNGDAVSGVTIMQIKPRRFDVGPILNQCVYQIPENSTADQLGETLATMGAQLLIKTLKTLPESIANRREQSKCGATLAPKINTSMSWVQWEEQTCDEIGRLFRAIGSRIPLRTIWMGETIKLLDFAGKFSVTLSDQKKRPTPGSIYYQKESDTLLVCCKDGWVGFRAIMLKKSISAADFYNGYLHQFFLKKFSQQHKECLFQSNKLKSEDSAARQKNSQIAKMYSDTQ